MKSLKPLTEKIPAVLKYTLLLFFTTRLSLLLIGVLSRLLLKPYHAKPAVWIYHKKLWLDIWGLWDSGWYLNIAQNGYPHLHTISGQSNYGFFPFYPLLIHLGGFLTKNNYLAGLIISNLCLIFTCLLLYKLVKLDYSEEIALASIKYLLLFPTAFILSGLFSESLYLMLAVACFYCARTGKWLIAGIAGFFLSLTKSAGILIIIPLLYEYLKQKGFKLSRIRLNALCLLLIPLGLVLFLFYCQYQTGDFLAYPHTEAKGWFIKAGNPFSNLLGGLMQRNLNFLFGAYFALTACLFIPLIFRDLGVSYGLFALCSTIFPLTFFQPGILPSIPRYLVALFPLHILFARLENDRAADTIITISLALLQGFLMTLWANGYAAVI